MDWLPATLLACSGVSVGLSLALTVVAFVKDKQPASEPKKEEETCPKAT